MIKINLLHSVTERHSGATVVVERKMSNPQTRLLLMALAVGVLTVGLIAWDVIGTNWRKADAETRLAEQKQIAAELEAVMKEQKELEAKIQNIDLRIAAIKKLRDSQAGPSAVLKEVSDRIVSNPGLYLESVEQTGEKVVIKGSSPDEDVVAQFGRSLEFSGGLFTNLNITTERKDVDVQTASTSTSEAPKKEIVNFTITVGYSPTKGNAPGDGSTTTASNAAPSAPAQAANVPKPAAPPKAQNQ